MAGLVQFHFQPQACNQTQLGRGAHWGTGELPQDSPRGPHWGCADIAATFSPGDSRELPTRLQTKRGAREEDSVTQPVPGRCRRMHSQTSVSHPRGFAPPPAACRGPAPGTRCSAAAQLGPPASRPALPTQPSRGCLRVSAGCYNIPPNISTALASRDLPISNPSNRPAFSTAFLQTPGHFSEEKSP